MKSFNNLSITNNYKGSAIAIGNFDGVHKGHQKIFRKAKNFARKIIPNYDMVHVCTWYSHICMVFAQIAYEKKFRLLFHHGVRFYQLLEK